MIEAMTTSDMFTSIKQTLVQEISTKLERIEQTLQSLTESRSVLLERKSEIEQEVIAIDDQLSQEKAEKLKLENDAKLLREQYDRLNK